MANRILVDTGWQQRIRDKLGLLEPYLPDSVIEQPENITVAEANIIAQLPDYGGLEDDAKVYLEAAVVCECAALICPSLSSRLPTKETGPHESHELDMDWTEKQKIFEVERDGFIGRVIEIAFPELRPPPLLHFTVTRPRRW